MIGEALFLHEVEGYSASEISPMTGQPRGTVLSLMHRAR
jgi:DNA-directed RNA polymerase specialized sigma24 family protein